MHFWNVPRLGSFMAVPLVYKSSLSVNSLQNAYDDFISYTDSVQKQNEQIQEYEDAQEALRNDAEAQGTQFVPEEKEFPKIEMPAVQTTNKKFVVCIDSMGQDRVFTAEERTFILETVHKYRTHWEIFENDKLVQDRNCLIEQKKKDEEVINEEYLLTQKEDLEELVQAKIDPQPPADSPRADGDNQKSNKKK